MAQGKPQLKFERNPCVKFRDNCDTDGRRTDDGRRTKTPYHDLCCQAELKNEESGAVRRNQKRRKDRKRRRQEQIKVQKKKIQKKKKIEKQ